ncbi:MAG: amino-acid N-acetyltransferase [Gammaproteobacteria bacterium]|nr:amino-acid N-acetyltransferase [Gammaproteobacteria bacterium]NIR82468.1 amino-acid N-acetyltransferase [Gammaproteobacteria bacterium]NIR88464.1 amino-acid N-acetyltransferase [Gammaproteobacteria bacterium]NIU03604.1 amino-acid N-acetyltransferase [Gammaproteobacteria bacterium]NIV50956.1 amino-acid N-acetyltransferase [Gammaproteobacteria bacterium]
MSKQQRYVEWFRSSAPYINAHRGRTFVVQFGGEVVLDPAFPNLVHDIALLESLGIRLVLVFGVRPQVEHRLVERGSSMEYRGGRRITDEAALAAVKEAAGAVRLEIEALLSMGLANSPMAGAGIRVVSGNFVLARPIGVRDGADFGYSGEVRRVDTESLDRHLHDGDVVLVPPIGFSPTGEMFNLGAEEVATAIASSLPAAKLLLLGERAGVTDAADALVSQLTVAEATVLLARRRQQGFDAADEITRHLISAIQACQSGVQRVHLLDRRVDGALLLELFTRDGVGTMVNADPYDTMRRATIDDVGGLLGLIEPLEHEGVLVRRSREKLENEIQQFTVMERDGTVIGCAAGYPFRQEGVMELACLAVHADYAGGHRGDALLQTVEKNARAMGLNRLFVLTTRAEHWFMERGFVKARLEDLPVERQALYNYKRNSKVLIKTL